MKVSDHYIAGCKKGERRAQEEIYRLLYPESFKVAMRYTHDKMEAQDVLNKAFLKALTKIDTFQGDGNNFFGWLKRIVINQALDNKKASSFSRSFEPLDANVNDKGIDPFREQEEFDDVIALIQKLPPTSACVFNLFAIDGFNHREIAQKLGITEDNSRYHLHAARKRLKSWLFKTTTL